MGIVKKVIKNVLPYYLVKKITGTRWNENSSVLKTSLSDNEKYPDFCLKASSDRLLFSNFRQNSVYRQILEHVDSETGRLYLDEIKEIQKDLLKDIEKIKENDIYGNPYLVEYEIAGEICPSTLRYAKVMADLLNMFNSLDGLNIAEIGVGYGGQCRIINRISKPVEYTLIDIKPALLLAQTYLDGYVLQAVMKYKTMNELSKDNYDLVISNYAFTELRREIQDVYLEKIIINSSKGYITYNEITPDYFGSYRREELTKIIPGAHIIEERPLTHEKNCIIIWGIAEQ
jgi:putative sugar O-methyltransferase